MSVLIKGMKMPGSCTMCWLSPICPVWVKEVSRHKGYDDRLPDCPLVEIPTPHGHLIDSAELLSAKFAGIYHDPVVSDGVEKTDEEVYAYRVGWNTALDAAYLNAPIVVSAEDG